MLKLVSPGTFTGSDQKQRRHLRVTLSGMNTKIFTRSPVIDLREDLRLSNMKQIVSVGVEYVRFTANVADNQVGMGTNIKAVTLTSETGLSRSVIEGVEYVNTQAGVHLHDFYVTGKPMALLSRGELYLTFLNVPTQYSAGQVLTLDSIVLNVFDYLPAES